MECYFRCHKRNKFRHRVFDTFTGAAQELVDFAEKTAEEECAKELTKAMFASQCFVELRDVQTGPIERVICYNEAKRMVQNRPEHVSFNDAKSAAWRFLMSSAPLDEKATLVCEVLCTFANSSGGSEALAAKVRSEHRTKQQGIFGMFMACVKEWAGAYGLGLYDGRNEYTVSKSAEIFPLFEGVERPPYI